jgi:hypothetical protein
MIVLGAIFVDHRGSLLLFIASRAFLRSLGQVPPQVQPRGGHYDDPLLGLCYIFFLSFISANFGLFAICHIFLFLQAADQMSGEPAKLLSIGDAVAKGAYTSS